MKRHTIVWAKLESVGKPKAMRKFNCSVFELTREIAVWLLTTYMGSKMRITIAMTEAELEFSTGKAGIMDQDMMADIEQMMEDVANQAEAPELGLRTE